MRTITHEERLIIEAILASDAHKAERVATAPQRLAALSQRLRAIDPFDLYTGAR